MIWMYPKHKEGQPQFCYFYPLRYPDLRGGAYLADIVAGMEG